VDLGVRVGGGECEWEDGVTDPVRPSREGGDS
jgi:hypothetical protein